MSATLLTALALALVHLAAGTTTILGHRWRPRMLSAASGVSVAYVFLPDTDRSGDVVAFAMAAAVYGVLLLSLSPAG